LKAVAYASTDWTQLTKTQTKHQLQLRMKTNIILSAIAAILLSACKEKAAQVVPTPTPTPIAAGNTSMSLITIVTPTSPVAPEKKISEPNQDERERLRTEKIRAEAKAALEELEKKEAEIELAKRNSARKIVSPASPVRNGPAQNVGNQSFLYTFALPVAASEGSEQRTVTVKIDNQAWKVPDAEVRQNFLARGATWESVRARQRQY
jgi:hypothetical protein